MLPSDFNMNLYRGDTGRWQFKLWSDTTKTQPVDLTGVSAAATLRDKAVGGAFALDLACTITLPNLIEMVLSTEASRDLPAKGVWDLQLTYAGGDVVTILKGTVAVTQDVTYSPAHTAVLRVVP